MSPNTTSYCQIAQQRNFIINKPSELAESVLLVVVLAFRAMNPAVAVVVDATMVAGATVKPKKEAAMNKAKRRPMQIEVRVN